MSKIKICGLRRSEDIAYANELKPDYIGFIFFEKSKRAVSDAQAMRLRKQLDASIPAVGVFVDDDPKHILALAHAKTIDLIQLHGNEDEDYILALKKQTQLPILKAFVIQSQDDIEQAKISSADYILLDSGQGSGKTFAWKLIKNIDRPYFLAGGLDASNIRKAIDSLHPYALDLSSSVEIEGYKDYDLMKEVIQRTRRGDEHD